MSMPAIIALAPFLIIGIAAVVVMLAAAFWRNHTLVFGLTVAGLSIAGVASVFAMHAAPQQVTSLFLIDRFALFYVTLMIACCLAVVFLAYGYWAPKHILHEEFYFFLLLSNFGAMAIAASSHLAALFLGLEILGVPLYVLIAYQRANPLSIEAGIKYLIPASTATAFLLFGMALVYADTGTMEFGRLIANFQTHGAITPLSIVGLLLIIVAIGFKLSLVPFHWWAADVYQGAPAPATAFLATVSKIAVLALLIRLYYSAGSFPGSAVRTALWSMAVCSMFVGNLLALRQDSLMRVIAYSSIAHMGYVLVALLSSSQFGLIAASYYIAAYAITVLGALSVIAVLSPIRPFDSRADYRGLGFQNKPLAVLFSIALLSLAGIPLTAGFLGKFLVLSAGIQSHIWLLAVGVVLSSAIGLCYYLRIVIAFYQAPLQAPGAAAGSIPLPAPSVGGGAVAWGATIALVYVGIFPSPLLRILQWVLGQ
jgi:NADH-quinone oxidoreductase subunit N